jgi:hypothetical protein
MEIGSSSVVRPSESIGQNGLEKKETSSDQGEERVHVLRMPHKAETMRIEAGMNALSICVGMAVS